MDSYMLSVSMVVPLSTICQYVCKVNKFIFFSCMFLLKSV